MGPFEIVGKLPDYKNQQFGAFQCFFGHGTQPYPRADQSDRISLYRWTLRAFCENFGKIIAKEVFFWISDAGKRKFRTFAGVWSKMKSYWCLETILVSLSSLK